MKFAVIVGVNLLLAGFVLSTFADERQQFPKDQEEWEAWQILLWRANVDESTPLKDQVGPMQN